MSFGLRFKVYVWGLRIMEKKNHCRILGSHRDNGKEMETTVMGKLGRLKHPPGSFNILAWRFMGLSSYLKLVL